MSRAFSRIVIALFAGCMFVANAGAQSAKPERADPLNYATSARKQDEVFLISTRQLGEPKPDGPMELELRRWNESDAWQPLSVDAFLAEDAGEATTLIYVHGYSFDQQKAERMGWAFYHALCDDLPSQRRVRFIIWSWPTVEKRFRPKADLAAKALRADGDAYRLARLLNSTPGEQRVCLIGSALGCRVVEGTLHMLGGGNIADWKLPRRDDKPGPIISAAVITAAVNDDWLEDGKFHDRALAGARRLLLINNSEDALLRRYGIVWHGNPRALGIDGIQRPAKFGELAKRIEQFDAHEQIGESHGIEHYLRSPEIVKKLQAFVFSAAARRNVASGGR